jgi:small subunit ribosomal protein S6
MNLASLKGIADWLYIREENIMPFYETVFIARQDLSDAQVKSITEAAEKVITDAKGKVVKTENWGLRTLAYKINKNKKGHYVLIESDAPAPAVIEMERTLRLNEEVVRYMTIRLDELSKGPSKPIDKSSNDDFDGGDRPKFGGDDRPDRGDRGPRNYDNKDKEAA